jgi:phage shock protein C
VTDRLYRSPTDRVIAGVAGGLAVWLNIDPSLVRIAWVLLGVFSGGIFVLVYFVMMIVVPLPPPGWVPQARGASGGAWSPGTGGGWSPGTPGAGAVPGWDTGASPGGAPGDATQTGWSTSPQGYPPQQPWVAPKVDTSSAGIVAGVVLVLLGAWFLVDQYIDIDWDLVWPVVVIGLGALLIVGAMRRGRSGAG